MNLTWQTWVLVATGGAIGAWLRFWISSRMNGTFPSSIPYGTLTVNLGGAFALGWLLFAMNEGALYAWFGIGILGSLTTFSTLMLEIQTFLKRRAYGKLCLYATVTLCCGILLIWIGYHLGDHLHS